MEFKEKDNVYVETYERDFEYDLSKKDSEVGFFDTSRSDSYQIKKTSEDEIGLEGLYSQEGHACIFEQN